jgi:hypothetical protein
LFPAYALLRGDTVTMKLACTTACTGTGSLTDAAAGASSVTTGSKKSSGAVLAQFKFQLTAKGIATIHVRLTPHGRKLVANKKRMIVSASIAVAVGNGRPVTYVRPLDVTRTTPKQPRKATLLRDGALLASAVIRLGG